jgi:2-polyprenyl-3-methyl-5-hydroxy-6-metoxy-1,4-benzoquinol methylase
MGQSDIQMNGKRRINQEYNDCLYQPCNTFLRWLHGRVSFDQQSKLRPNRAALAPIFKEIAKAGGRARVLDYGCGWGIFLLSLPRRQVEAYYYDISEPAMSGLAQVMRMLGRQVNRVAVAADGEITPGNFDLIVCSHVLEHVEDDRALIANLTRALRVGGVSLDQRAHQ